MYGSGKFDVAPAPPVPQLCASNAVSVPSAETPARMCAVADGRLPVSRCSSLRSSISLTGTLACCASRAQMMPSASGAELAAEAAAHVLRDDADVRPAGCSSACAKLLRALRARACVDTHAVSLSPSHSQTVPCVSRQHVRDDVRRVGLLDDVRGLLEAGVEIAGLLAVARARVLPLVNTTGASGAIACSTFAKCGSALVAHAHETRGVVRALFRVGRDGGDRIALEHHLGAGLLPGEHRLDARRLLRFGESMDTMRACGMRRADDPAVDHPGPVDVVGVLRAAGDFVGRVEPLDRRCR